jgi:hypothetical protein
VKKYEKISGEVEWYPFGVPDFSSHFGLALSEGCSYGAETLYALSSIPRLPRYEFSALCELGEQSWVLGYDPHSVVPHGKANMNGPRYRDFLYLENKSIFLSQLFCDGFRTGRTIFNCHREAQDVQAELCLLGVKTGQKRMLLKKVRRSQSGLYFFLR